MSQALPNQNPPIDVDDTYRRASALDESRPSEWVRRKVLAHAAQLGAERTVRESAGARAPRSQAAQPAAIQTSRSPGRTAVFGAVAAVAVVVVFAAWHFLSPQSSSATATNPKRQTEQIAPQRANTSEPSTPETTVPTQSASADQPTVAPPSAAAEPKPAPPSQAPQSSGSPPPPASAMTSAAPTTSGSGDAHSAGAAVPAPRLSKQTPPATSATATARQVTTLKPARVTQSTDTAQTSASAGNSVARNAAPDAQAASLPVTTVAPTPAPAPSTTAIDPQPAAAPTPSATSAPSSEPTQPADALWRAAETGNVHNLLAALDNHININARDTEGRTALMLAIVHDKSGAVKALLQHGADPNIPDGQNRTPLQAANAGGQWLFVVFLKRAGAK